MKWLIIRFLMILEYSMTIPTKEHKKNQEKDEIIKQMKKKKKLIF